MEFKFIAKENISHLPKSPGVYAFKKGTNLLYIGKATNIKERVKNHFLHSTYRDNLFINQMEKVGYIETDSEPSTRAKHSAGLVPHRNEVSGAGIEALILEANLIKKYQPKYNVMWRDDKNYFYVGITKEGFPRVFITHQPKLVSRILHPVSSIKSKRIQNTKYKILNTKFVGPFVDGRALKQTLDALRKVFPYRTCKILPKHPCLWHQLNRCLAPCLLKSLNNGDRVSIVLTKKVKKECQENVKNLMKILRGKKTQVLKDLKREMKSASKIQDFEKAAKIRDQILSLEKVLAHSKIIEHKALPEIALKSYKETEKRLKKILKAGNRISRIEAIEAYDVSNIQGEMATGAMVTFIDGRPDKNFYRRFKIKISGKPDDVAMLKEVLTRRFSHPEWGWPDLILIDGGKAQLKAALEVKNQPRVLVKPTSGVGYGKMILALALAKKENKLFIEGKKQPILLKSLPREIFNLILQLRDEAHRFARKYHHKLREIDFLSNL